MAHSEKKSLSGKAERISLRGEAKMAGNDSALRDEVAELQALLAQTRMPGNVRDLQHLLVQKQHLLAEQEQRDQAVAAPVEEVDGAPVIPLPAPVKVAAHAVKRDEVDDLNVYTEISRFGWEDEGTKKVLVWSAWS